MYKKTFKFNSKFRDECRKSQKQGNQTTDKNRLEHRYDFIQKNFPKSVVLLLKKRNIFFTDASKIKQLF